MHWPQWVTLITWWAGTAFSLGRFAWKHWDRQPTEPEPGPEAEPMPDDDDYIERQYRDQ